LYYYYYSKISVRPVNSRELEKNDRSILHCENENSLLVIKHFKFEFFSSNIFDRK